MADKKVTALSALASVTTDDLFLIVNDPQGTPASYKVSAKNIFKSVPANTAIKGLFTTVANTIVAGNQANVSANATFSSKVTVSGDKKFILSTKSTNPGNSNAVSQSVTAGTIFYSNTYLYIATDGNTIKRIALSTF